MADSPPITRPGRVAALLSFVAGYVDTVGFIALFGLFTAHVTGNFVLIGASFVAGTDGGVIAKLLALPVFLPIYQAADINMIWFGILFIKYIEIGLITPPVGMNVFILRSILPQIPVGTIFRGTGWFFVTEIVVVGLLIAFPAISLVLAESAR